MSIEEKVRNQYELLLKQFRKDYSKYLNCKKHDNRRSLRMYRNRCTRIQAQLNVLGWILEEDVKTALKNIVNELREEKQIGLSSLG